MDASKPPAQKSFALVTRSFTTQRTSALEGRSTQDINQTGKFYSHCTNVHNTEKLEKLIQKATIVNKDSCREN